MWEEVAASFLFFYHDRMRKALAILVLAAACATSNTPARMHVEVFGQRANLTGPRTYVVRVTNTSDKDIMIHSINVHAPTTSQFEFNAMPELVDTPLRPNESMDFPITVQVEVTRGAAGDAGLVGASDSVRVDISGETEGATWSDSGTYSVGYARP